MKPLNEKGARNSALDLAKIQEIHKHTTALGATCTDMPDRDSTEAGRELLSRTLGAFCLDEAGARNSKADLMRIQAVHDASYYLGANCPDGSLPGDQDNAGEDLRRAEALRFVHEAGILRQADAHDDLRSSLQKALINKHNSATDRSDYYGSSTYPAIRDVFPDQVVYQHDNKLKASTYTKGDDGKIALGDEQEVEPAYVSKANLGEAARARRIREAGAILRQDDSLSGKETAIRRALNAKFSDGYSLSYPGSSIWVRDVFDDQVVFCIGSQCFSAPYTIDDKGNATIGDATKVCVAYVPDEDKDVPAESAAALESAKVEAVEGATSDQPEGSRFVRMSETVVKKLARMLRRMRREGGAGSGPHGGNPEGGQIPDGAWQQAAEMGSKAHKLNEKSLAALAQLLGHIKSQGKSAVTEASRQASEAINTLLQRLQESRGEEGDGDEECPECDGTGKCPECKGTGKLDGDECAECGGTGKCEECEGTGEIDEAAETLLTSDLIGLKEGAVTPGGQALLKVINPGWGSSGYYSAEMLKRDGPQIFKAGTKMYADHPTEAEEQARPERSIRDLMATLSEDAHYEEKGPDGPGLYAKADVIEPWRAFVEQYAPHIGVSIRALGRASTGEAEGRRGPIIQSLAAAKSIDFVTTAGRGGKVLPLYESFRQAGSAAPGRNTNQQEQPMTDQEKQEFQALRESNATLNTEVARLKERNMLSEAVSHVTHQLNTEGKPGFALPQVTKRRLIESLAKNPPTTADGSLDKAAFTTKIDEAVTAEAAYLSEAGAGSVRNLGAAAPATAPAEGEVNTLLEAEFTKLLGPNGAKVAAYGR